MGGEGWRERKGERGRKVRREREKGREREGGMEGRESGSELCTCYNVLYSGVQDVMGSSIMNLRQ